MKVAILKSGLSRTGGLEKYTWRLARALQQKNHAVTLISTEAPAPSDVPIVAEPLRSLLSFRKVQEFDRYCQKTLGTLKPDVIFGMDRNRFQTHLRAGNGVHAAYLQHRALHDSLFKRLSFRINPLHKTLLHLEKTAFEHPCLEKLYTNSRMVRDEILHFYKTDPKKIHVVHNGVEWHEMQAPFDAWEEQQKCRASYSFLFIGHNYQRKGLRPLLQGLSLLSTQDFTLTVIGKDKNTAHFKALAKRLGLENRVHFLGARTDIIPFYQQSDCLVIPSFYDPFANVTLEALAMGLYVVSSKTNGGHEVLSPESGTVIEALTDPTSVAAALEEALKHPKTEPSAQAIRDSVRHLDFARQLSVLTDL